MALGDATRINTNIAAFNALSALKSVNRDLEQRQLKLATGRRINEVADDPAGFVISRRLIARSRGLSTALDNVGTTKNVLAIAEGGLLNMSDILVRMKELATQAANDTLGSAERNAITSEFNQLGNEMDDIIEETTFNNNRLLDGTFTGRSFQTGEETTATLNFDLATNNSSTGLKATVEVIPGSPGSATELSIRDLVTTSRLFSASGCSISLAIINNSIEQVSDALQDIGAITARLTVKESTLRIAITNTEAAKSRILDADIAQEQLESTRLQILQQTATAQLAQANVAPQNVLALFQ
jgi:flagellin